MALVRIQPNMRELAAIRSAVARATEQSGSGKRRQAVYPVGASGVTTVQVNRQLEKNPNITFWKKNDGETELQAAEQQETQLRGWTAEEAQECCKKNT